MAEAASTLPERPRVGEIVEGYEVVGLLAGGGMGEVHLVRRRRAGGFEKKLAMKVLHPHLAGDPGMIAMFLDEARIASQVAHPNVVEVIDTGTHRGLPWLVMELIDGRSLAETVGERPRPAWIAHVLARAARGLHAAHEAVDADGRPLGIVHRDVSPQNVLVALDGRVKVVDFGIAAARGRLAQTATGELKGKIGYLAPEQLAGGRRRADRRVDVWAFGVTAWECFTGARLFDAESASARMRQVETMAIPDVREREPGIDAQLAEALAACLARDPATRAATLETVARALTRYAEQNGAAAEEDVARWMRARFTSRLGATERPESDVATARTGGAEQPRRPDPTRAAEASEVRRRTGASARVVGLGIGAVIVAAILASGMLARMAEPDFASESESESEPESRPEPESAPASTPASASASSPASASASSPTSTSASAPASASSPASASASSPASASASSPASSPASASASRPAPAPAAAPPAFASAPTARDTSVRAAARSRRAELPATVVTSAAPDTVAAPPAVAAGPEPLIARDATPARPDLHLLPSPYGSR